MSNALAIAAVTKTLRSLLDTGIKQDGLSNVSITTRTPDQARVTSADMQLNLFLYQTTISPTWRNTNPNSRDGIPPLGLNLHYLITAYNTPDDLESKDHQLFGAAMRTLNDHPMLKRRDIELTLKDAELHQQIELVRLSLLPMSLEELSKLWMTFQAPYRISAAFEASVVLIDSKRAQSSPLPVTSIGKDQRGPIAITDRLPILTELELPFRQNAIRLGESFTVRGQSLGLNNLNAFIERTVPGSDPPVLQRQELVISQANAESIRITMPNTLPSWGPGFYSLFVTVAPIDAQHELSSNTLALPLAPSITLDKNTAPPGTVILEVTCNPGLLENQRVVLLIGDRQVLLNEELVPHVPPFTTAPTDKVSFEIDALVAQPDPYTVRLRVDGADSVPVKLNASTLEFDPDQQLKIT
jgi:Pvc16 N-terminal domain